MTKLAMRTRHLLWWIGVPLLVALVSYGPFLFLRCVLIPSPGESCVRLFSVSQLVFDLHAYMEFMGGVLSGSSGIHLQWIEWIVKGLRFVMPGASVAELWLLMRFIFGVLTWWLFAWTLSFFGNNSVTQRRFSATILWIAVFLPLGFRPGVFSWFLPFGLVTIVACILAGRSLQNHRIMNAIGWSVLSIVSSLIYSWFFLFAAFWIGVIWMMRFTRRHPVVLWIFTSAAAVVATGGIVSIASDRISVSIQTLLRNGMGFTYIVQLSTMLIASVLWLLLCLIVARRSERSSDQATDRLLVFGWIVTIAGWCSSILTGLYLHNDHFRIFILLFAWISASVLLTRETVLLRTKKQRLIVWSILLISIGMIFSILVRPYVFDGDQLNIIHLFVWGALAITSYQTIRPTVSVSRSRTAQIILLLSACFAGFLPYVFMFIQEAKQLPDLRKYDPSVVWIEKNIPTNEGICADPIISEQIAAYAGHSVFFTMQSLYPSGTDQDLYARVAALASLTDASVSLTKDTWTVWLTSRGTACQQFGLYRKTIFSMLSPKSFDDLTGCPRQQMDAETAFVSRLANAYGTTNPVSSTLCRWIAFPVRAASHWSLDHYQTAYQDSFIQIERLK